MCGQTHHGDWLEQKSPLCTLVATPHAPSGVYGYVVRQGEMTRMVVVVVGSQAGSNSSHGIRVWLLGYKKGQIVSNSFHASCCTHTMSAD